MNTVEKVFLNTRSYKKEKAVVVLSGGQDSITCLYWALAKFEKVLAINFDYGQRHSEETNYAWSICSSEGVPFKSIDISSMMEVTTSALLDDSIDINSKNIKGLPASFVPNRNQLFLTLAHSYAQLNGAEHLVTGVCQTDYSGYPDCRKDFIDSFQSTTNLGSNERITIHTPLMYLTKADTFCLSKLLGCYDTIIESTLTCYNGDTTDNSWGMGCGECPACKLRRNGWDEYRVSSKYSKLEKRYKYEKSFRQHRR